VENTFDEFLGGFDAAEWSRPKGGYFICFRLKHGGAKRVVAMCAQAGVKLTPAGAGFPYGVDPTDSYIRIAPTFPSVDDLKRAAELLSICALLVALENNTPLEV
jgi:DNA-binding transcriptional MocR family regulator